MVADNKVRFLTEFEMQTNNFEIERIGDRILTTADIDIFRGTAMDDYIGKYWKLIMGCEPFNIFHSFLMRTTSANNTIQVAKKEISEECGVSITRTSEAVRRLKELGFIQEISLNEYVRNVYVVRNQTIPIIPQKEFEKFPEQMKLEHDEYLSSRL